MKDIVKIMNEYNILNIKTRILNIKIQKLFEYIYKIITNISGFLFICFYNF